MASWMTRSAAITSGPPVSAGGSAIATARKTSMMVPPGNAGLPASISKRIAPTANRSEAGLRTSPSHCSGDM